MQSLKKKKDTAFFLTFYTFNILFFCLKIWTVFVHKIKDLARFKNNLLRDI